MAPILPSVEMEDPRQPGRLVHVLLRDRAEWEAKGYRAHPTQEERKGRTQAATPAPTTPESKPETPAATSTPPTPPAEDAPTAEAVAAFLEGSVRVVTERAEETKDFALLKAALEAERAATKPRKGVTVALEGELDRIQADEAYAELVTKADAGELTLDDLEAWDIDELAESLGIEDLPEGKEEKLAAVAAALKAEAAEATPEGAPAGTATDDESKGGVTFPRRRGNSTAPRN